ncbi:MAG TPA: hypothetical protein VIJ94_18855 [Caulobacteraceae bacterium]
MRARGVIFVAAVAAAVTGQAFAATPAGVLPASAPDAVAPPPPTNMVAPVTVTAPVRGSALALSRNFIEAYAAPTARLDRYARWAAPPCVVVSGLAAAQSAAIKARVEEVARSAGLKVGAPGCKANVEIEFTSQPQALIDQIAQKTPQVLGFQPGSDAKAQKTLTRPIQAWYMTASRGGVNALDKRGAMDVVPRPSLAAPNPGTTTLAGPLSPNAAGWARTNSIETRDGRRQATPEAVLSIPESLDGPSRESAAGCAPQASSCRSVFWNVLVVVDIGRVQDQSVSSLTDYVAMLALSQPRSLDGCMALASIIDLLAPAACADRDPPDSLTPVDSAYLAALYDSAPEANRTMQRSAMSERMAGILVKAASKDQSAETKAPSAP